MTCVSFCILQSVFECFVISSLRVSTTYVSNHNHQKTLGRMKKTQSFVVVSIEMIMQPVCDKSPYHQNHSTQCRTAVKYTRRPDSHLHTLKSCHTVSNKYRRSSSSDCCIKGRFGLSYTAIFCVVVVLRWAFSRSLQLIDRFGPLRVWRVATTLMTLKCFQSDGGVCLCVCAFVA